MSREDALAQLPLACQLSAIQWPSREVVFQREN
jgi:hypothetical protein